ncbi:MAG TPA: tRNA (adenosine(37)-N6)-threonylcarbamoyltransferase complex transferase subunit TsaD [Saprospiraceae bacterium]|nr:tRNA (adenosine(37)-N6)-threonylcarbamoyltransferase complex transferase subunit TsaD [Saprospiraceae bacterium]
MQHTILAIESSCDDTSAAIIQNGSVRSNIVASQDAHRLYGGVVPEVASRAHQNNIVPVVRQALADAEVSVNQLDAVAFTRGPGLVGSLIVGISFAKALALSQDIPLIEVNHLQAHVLSAFAQKPYPSFPFLCLTVSGGHTQIVLVRSPLDMEIIGQSIDDAAGEAFDKSGKMMGLDYPAGPIIDKLAQKGRPVFEFPQPKIQGFNYSFSGIKTAFKYFLRDQVAANPDFIAENKYDIAASIQHRIVTILLQKLRKAARKLQINQITIAGGVSANSYLRTKLQEMGEKERWDTFIPPFKFCTDNAGMIAVAARFKYMEGEFSDQSVGPLAKWKF